MLSILFYVSVQGIALVDNPSSLNFTKNCNIGWLISRITYFIYHIHTKDLNSNGTDGQHKSFEKSLAFNGIRTEKKDMKYGKDEFKNYMV